MRNEYHLRHYLRAKTISIKMRFVRNLVSIVSHDNFSWFLLLADVRRPIYILVVN